MSQLFPTIDKGATLSECRTYRYSLWRIWDPALPVMTWIGLNPSTADETKDDMTIKLCVQRAKMADCGGIRMLNLFAFRATKPADMKLASDPVGPENNATLMSDASDSGKVVAAWGADGDYLGRAAQVIRMMAVAEIPLYCLGTTKGGHPKHPLRIPYTQEFVRFGGSE